MPSAKGSSQLKAQHALDKINSLIFKNYCSIKRLIVETEIGFESSRVDLKTITEVSRRSRAINHQCISELTYMLDQNSLNQYSSTIRMMFQIFSLVEDLFIENYLAYIKFFFNQSKYVSGKDSLMQRFNSQFDPAEIGKKMGDSECVADHRGHAHGAKREIEKGGLEKVKRMMMMGQDTGAIFEEDEDDRMRREMRMRQRQAHVDERVNQLLFIWDKTQSSTAFAEEKDPEVILGIQRKLHKELEIDFQQNIAQMDNYLNRQDSQVYKKLDSTAVTNQLRRLETSMKQGVRSAETHSNLTTTTTLSLGPNFADLINPNYVSNVCSSIEKGIFDSFSVQQRKLILSLIAKIMGLRAAKVDATTLTIG
jgi:hypothetical protein